MNFLANIVCGWPRVRTYPDLITSQRASPAIKQDRVTARQNFAETPLERSIAVENFWARSMCNENGAPGLTYINGS
jgi:hypothetical protein